MGRGTFTQGGDSQKFGGEQLYFPGVGPFAVAFGGIGIGAGVGLFAVAFGGIGIGTGARVGVFVVPIGVVLGHCVGVFVVPVGVVLVFVCLMLCWYSSV